MPNNTWDTNLESMAARIAQRDADRDRLRGMQSVSMDTVYSGAMYSPFMSGSTIGNWSPMTTTWSSGGSGMSEKEKNKTAIKVLDKIKASAKLFETKEEDGNAVVSKAQEFRDLGLTKIAEQMEEEGVKAWKEFKISAAGYKRINRSELNAFKKELEHISDSSSKRRLQETALAEYVGQNNEKKNSNEGYITINPDGSATAVKEKTENMGVPPAEVLELLKTAREAKVFDDYSVLHIQYVPDPILCGKINESEDLYFIAEWGDDVKLTDIVK